MATGKVARRAAVSEISELLDSKEVAGLISRIGTVGSPRGRKGYGARALVGACLIKSLYGLPTWTRVAALIADHPGLQRSIGGCPSVWAIYRFTVKLREHSTLLADCLDEIAASLQERMPDLGAEIAIDGSDMPAFANGHKFISRYGPERKLFSDPDASWGHRSAVSTRKGGGFYGFKLHMAVCTRTGLPLAWRVETARRHESLYVAPLLDAVRARGYRPETCAMDKGYDYNRVYEEVRERDCVPIVARKKTRHATPLTPIPHGSEEWKSLYRNRGAVEREFGRLKHDYALAPLRVRGLARVQLHADLTILARLALALNRAQEAIAVAA
ncbi:MAG TPA: transposase [Gaiellaceae bacterium]|nr:transposase [Gaiellaceae bacterium]